MNKNCHQGKNRKSNPAAMTAEPRLGDHPYHLPSLPPGTVAAVLPQREYLEALFNHKRLNISDYETNCK